MTEQFPSRLKLPGQRRHLALLLVQELHRLLVLIPEPVELVQKPVHLVVRVAQLRLRRRELRLETLQPVQLLLQLHHQLVVRVRLRDQVVQPTLQPFGALELDAALLHRLVLLALGLPQLPLGLVQVDTRPVEILGEDRGHSILLTPRPSAAPRTSTEEARSPGSTKAAPSHDPRPRSPPPARNTGRAHHVPAGRTSGSRSPRCHESSARSGLTAPPVSPTRAVSQPQPPYSRSRKPSRSHSFRPAVSPSASGRGRNPTPCRNEGRSNTVHERPGPDPSSRTAPSSPGSEAASDRPRQRRSR